MLSGVAGRQKQKCGSSNRGRADLSDGQIRNQASQTQNGTSTNVQEQLIIRNRVSTLYRLQGSLGAHLDNCTAKIQEKASCNLRKRKRKIDGKKRRWLRGHRRAIGLRIWRKNQATKSTGWMPWHHTPKKDVASCEKLRGAASRH